MNRAASARTVLMTMALVPALGVTPGLGGVGAARAQGDAGPPPAVIVVDPGSEPRSLLRYRFTAGGHETASMEMTMSMETEMDGEAFAPVTTPPMIFTMDVDIIDVLASGTATVAFAYTGATVQDDPAFDPGTLAVVRAGLAGLVGTTGTLIVDARGQVLASTIVPGAGMDATSRQLLTSLNQQASQMTVPLPETAVGEGARWTATTRMTISGVKADQVMDYHVTRLGPGGVELTLTLTQAADAQPMDIPDLPSGAEALLELWNRGTGSMAIELDRMLPVSSMEASGGSRMTMTYEEQTFRAVTKTVLTMTLQPEGRDPS